jgi:hypothetical protein
MQIDNADDLKGEESDLRTMMTLEKTMIRVMKFFIIYPKPQKSRCFIIGCSNHPRPPSYNHSNVIMGFKEGKISFYNKR